jgi:outer membrane murein-binding lipoprotein Lpp
MKRRLVSTAVLMLFAAPLCAFAADGDGAGISGSLMGIALTLATGAIATAIKSWSDVNVLKVETARLARDVDGAAEATHVTESLARIERRLDEMDRRLGARG